MTTLGLGSAADRECAKSEARGRSAAGTALLWSLVTSPVALLAGLAISALTLWEIAPELIAVSAISTGVWIWSQQIGNAAESYWLANRPRIAIVANYIGAATCLVAVFLYLLDLLGLELAIITTALGTIVPYVFYAVCVRPSLTDRLPLREQLRFGLRAYPAVISNSLNQRLDVILVAAIAGYEATGYYAVATSSAQFLSTFGVAWAMRSQARLNAEHHLTPTRAREEMQDAAVGALKIGILTAAVIPPLILIAYGTEFSSALVPAFILIPGTIAQVVSAVGARCCVLIGLPGVPSKAEILALAITAGLIVPAIAIGGIIGAAILSTFTYLVRMAYIWRSLNRSDSDDKRRSARSVIGLTD